MSSRIPLYQTIGIDVGGANIKIAEPDGRSMSAVFPLWKHPDRLGEQVRGMLAEFGRPQTLAVTLTGELADCYQTRREGVTRILDQLTTCIEPSGIQVYAVDGSWKTVREAQLDPWSVAAANWSALAHWLCRFPPTAAACIVAVLLDIGSTTTDIIPIRNGRPDLAARTDRSRLQCGRLVYTGLSRTPVCAVVKRLKLRGEFVPVMAEFFAMVDDAYVISGRVAEAPNDVESADGRPRTIECARARIARMIGEDSETIDSAEIDSLADQIIEAQVDQIAAALAVNLQPDAAILVTGHGNSPAELVIDQLGLRSRTIKLSDLLGPEASRSAPAVAVAWLWEHGVAQDQESQSE
ncbi:MAG: hydantoinase/oxoprolinase family protein [Pirellulales bacterium]